MNFDISERNADLLESLFLAVQDIQKCVVKIKKSVDGQQEMLEDLHGQMNKSRPDDGTSRDSDVLQQMFKSLTDLIESKSTDSMKEMKATSSSIKNEVNKTTGNLKTDLALLANDVHDLKSWKEAMTPVLSEILSKARIAVYSNTQMAEDLVRQQTQAKVHTRRVEEVKDTVRNIEVTVNSQPTLSDVLSRDEARSEFDEIKDLINDQGDLPEVLDKDLTLSQFNQIKDLLQKQGTFDDANIATSSVTAHKSEFLVFSH